MSYYLRAGLWYAQGLLKYTSGAYDKASKSFNPLETDVSGRTFLVTGGSTGIGKAIGMDLVRRKGTSVHIVCRDEKNGASALEDLLKHAHVDSKAYLHLVDLSDANEINNAGALFKELSLDKNGIDKSFCLNVVSIYLLTNLLAPILLKSSTINNKSRVITVSSGGMLTVDLDAHTPDKIHKPYDGTYQYALYKRQQVVLMDLFADKYPEIFFCSMHPGWVDTPGVQNSLPSFYSSHVNSLRTPQQGADTVIWLAVSDEPFEHKNGGFFFDRQPASKFLISGSDRYPKNTENIYLSNLTRIIEKITSN